MVFWYNKQWVIKLKKQFTKVIKESFITAMIMSLAHLIFIFSDMRRRQALPPNLIFTLEIAIIAFLTLSISGFLFSYINKNINPEKKYKVASFILELFLIILLSYPMHLLFQDLKSFLFL